MATDDFESGHITDLTITRPYIPPEATSMAISLLPPLTEVIEDVSQIYEVQSGPSQNTPQQNMALIGSRPWTTDETGKEVVWSPGTPVGPVYNEHSPRAFDYRTGQNLIYTPRAGYDLVPFPYLRNLAKASQEIRIVYEMVKREVRALEYEIAPTERHGPTDGIEEVEAFIESPDGFMDFDAWVNALLEEILVIDAPCLHPVYNRIGKFTGLEMVAGDTIGPLLDSRGRIPRPPIPAYRQIIKGIPTSWYSTEELIYKPFNMSVNSPYGASPTEFILLSVNLALRRAALHVANFSEGNIPAAIMGAPEGWSQDQIKEWQLYWDSLITGKLSKQAKILWVPHQGGGSLPFVELRKDDITSTARDEWLLKIACWAVGASPAELGIIHGGALGGKGFSEAQQSAQFRNLIGPYTQYISRLLNRIIHRVMGYPNLSFKWQDSASRADSKAQADTDQIYVALGVYGPDYIQDRDGIPEEFRQTAKQNLQQMQQAANPPDAASATPAEPAKNPIQHLQAVAPLATQMQPQKPSPVNPVNLSASTVAQGKNTAAQVGSVLEGLGKAAQHSDKASPFGASGSGVVAARHRKATRTPALIEREKKLSSAMLKYFGGVQSRVLAEMEKKNARPSQ